jgi:hypothetical protein
MKIIRSFAQKSHGRRQWAAIASLVLATTFIFPLSARAADDSEAILKKMFDYVTSQKVISITFDGDIEVITSNLQKIQFTNSGQLLLNRPDKLRAHRVGGYADVELVFDGKKVAIYGKNLNAFTQLELAGSTDQLIDRLRDEYGVVAPGADLLLTDAYKALVAGVVDAKHIGQGVVDGVECEHLAFRNVDTDWQIWVEIGPRPIPRKYVITNKGVTGGPQYTLRIKEWKTDAHIAADAFVFVPPPGAKKVDLKEMSGIDEIPPGIAK